MTPAVAKDIERLRHLVAKARRSRLKVGLVPTMGALHEGHTSLIRAARHECGFVVVSIFVNPAQFGPNEDYARYPRPFEADLAVCAREGVDLIFAPEGAVMYQPGFRTFVEVRELQDPLCGASRPGHFRGVATVVLKLFNIVNPDIAYFGQKDAQQVRLIQQMVRDLNLPVEIRVCPIVREPDGLALSSRNQYLNPEQRRAATALTRGLGQAKSLVQRGERKTDAVRQALLQPILAAPGVEVEYAEVVNAETLRPCSQLSGKILLAVAVRLGSTRLIDNELIDV